LRELSRLGVLVLLALWTSSTWSGGEALAQQPSEAPASDSVKALSARSAASNRVTVTSGGVPVPFATVLNLNTGSAAVADVHGVVLVPLWGLNDTLKVQSMGYETVQVIPGPRALENVELSQRTVAIEEVVVQSNALASSAMTTTALRSVDRLVAKSPVLTAETTGDLLEGSGQVHLQMSQQGGISPVLRGFEANRVLLVVDGVRMNNAIYRAGHLQNAGSVDPFAVSQTQVVLGPSSVLYGSDALGGVVHFLTQPVEFNGGGVVVSGKALAQGTTVNGGWAGHVQAKVKAPNWGSVTSVSRREFGDLRMGTWRAHGDSTWGLVPWVVERVEGRDTLVANPNPEVQIPTAYEQWDLQQRFQVRSRRGHAEINVQHSTTGDVPRFDVQNDVSGGLPKWAEWNYGPQDRTLVALSGSRALRGGAVWSTLASYQAVEESRIKRRLGQDWRVTQLEELDVWGANSALRGHRRGVSWEAGLDGQWNDVSSTASALNLVSDSVSADLTRYADGGSSMATWGGFASAKRSWGDHTARLGVRYSHAAVRATFVDTTWLDLPVTQFDQARGAWTGSASWTGPLAPAIWATSSVASGFRHPNVDDVGKVREKDGFVLVPNPELKPEYLYTAEQAVSWSLRPQSDLLVIQAAAFGSLWKDAVVQANASLAGDTTMVVDGDTARIQMNQNLDRAWVRGARLEVSGRLWPQTTFRGVINWTLGNSMDDRATPLSHIPPTFGVVEVTRKLASGRLTSSVRYALPKAASDFGPGTTDNLQEALPSGIPGWATWNVEGSVRLTDRLEVRMAGLNLLDLHYRTFGSGISAPGRNVRATLAARF
jgi:hemoglobin/transferrin/lactoferrin receptor protein